MTTREDIKQWVVRGKADKKAYLMVVCDTFDWEDYPVYLSSKEDLDAAYLKYNGGNMQKIMEVVDLSKIYKA